VSKSFNVDVISPEGLVWSGGATMLIARTTEGEIGILAGHEPLIAELSTGAVVISQGSSSVSLAVSRGFLRVDESCVTVISDRVRPHGGGTFEDLRVGTE